MPTDLMYGVEGGLLVEKQPQNLLVFTGRRRSRPHKMRTDVTSEKNLQKCNLAILYNREQVVEEHIWNTHKKECKCSQVSSRKNHHNSVEKKDETSEYDKE